MVRHINFNIQIKEDSVTVTEVYAGLHEKNYNTLLKTL